MCKVISLIEYKDKKDEKTNNEGPFTFDELMVKFDEIGEEQKLVHFLDHEEIEQLLSQVEEVEAPF
jgi:hypothetical protein